MTARGGGRGRLHRSLFLFLFSPPGREEQWRNLPRGLDPFRTHPAHILPSSTLLSTPPLSPSPLPPCSEQSPPMSYQNPIRSVHLDLNSPSVIPPVSIAVSISSFVVVDSALLRPGCCDVVGGGVNVDPIAIDVEPGIDQSPRVLG